MKLSIIIVSFNTKDFLRKVIKSIPSKKTWEIIVVDNASSDGSPKTVTKHFPLVKLLRNQKNLGFAKANNQGIKASRGEYVLLLNSDTKVKPQALEKLIEFMDKNPDVGIASGQLLNPDGTIQPQGGYLPRLSNLALWLLFIDDIPGLNKLFHSYQLRNKRSFEKEIRLGWVSGTAMLIRKDMLEKTGLLDENIFMYGEDVELCFRAHKQGFKVALTPDSKIIHFGQQSSGGVPTKAWLGEFAGIKYFFKKHKSKWEYPLLRALLKIGALLRMFVFGILQGRQEVYEAYKSAYKLA